jgi:hypothetical protein
MSKSTETKSISAIIKFLRSKREMYPEFREGLADALDENGDTAIYLMPVQRNAWGKVLAMAVSIENARKAEEN